MDKDNIEKIINGEFERRRRKKYVMDGLNAETNKKHAERKKHNKEAKRQRRLQK